MKNWKEFAVLANAPILKTIDIIDKGGIQIALVVDENDFLLGTVTDGDIRRGILKGIALSQPVDLVMNRDPVTAGIHSTKAEILKRTNARQIRQVPVVDKKNKVIAIKTIADLVISTERPNWVVLMAGGMGSRLKPLTDTIPKPLLPIGSKPIMEITLSNLIEYGFRKFFLSVGYKAQMIEDHFQDGSRWGAEIHYIQEEQRMGTAGALGLLPDKPTHPLVVMNGDLLTKVNFHQLLDFHSERGVDGTMCVREYTFQVPYGVVKMDQEQIAGIDEKPVQKFFVNAGIYVVQPGTLSLIPPNTNYDMPTLFNQLVLSNQKTAAFPIREYWLDVGQFPDLEQAKWDFGEK